MAAPTFTNLTSGSSTTSFVTASVTPTAGRLVLIAINGYIATGGVNPGTPTVTGNGITYTLIQAQDIDVTGATDRSTLWVFRGMSAGPSAGAITIAWSGVVPTRASWIVDQSDANVNVSGTNGAGAIVAATLNGVTSSTTVTTQSVSFVGAMASGNGAYFACGVENNDTQTPEGTWTGLANSIGTTLVGVATQYLTTGTDTATATTWTNATRAAGILIEIAVAPIVYFNQYSLQGGTTGCTMIPPASTAATQMGIIFVGNKNSSVDPTDPGNGWARIPNGSAQVGTGADGSGTGKVRLTAWWKVFTGTESNLTLTLTGANALLAGGMVYSKSDPAASWAVPTISFGDDTVSDTSFSAPITDNLGLLVNEYLLSVGVFTLNTSLVGRGLAIPGVTFIKTSINSAPSANGNLLFLWTDHAVSQAGTQSSASTTTGTSGAATTGGAFNIRIGLASAIADSPHYQTSQYGGFF